MDRGSSEKILGFLTRLDSSSGEKKLSGHRVGRMDADHKGGRGVSRMISLICILWEEEI
jgi:hypothetical protein